MKNVCLTVVLVCALVGSVARAAVRRVPGEYPSIQQAITDCNDGDTVIVSPGVYYETINFSGKNITVTSTDPNDRGIVGYTILNADGDGTVVTFENGETNQAVLTGFTITGGVGTLTYDYQSGSFSFKEFAGGGIYCAYPAAPTISHCVVTRNNLPYYQRSEVGLSEYAYSYGGGIYCQGYRAVLKHNTVYNNSAYYGGGIYASNSATVSNNLIYNNSAGYGGGVYIAYGTLVNNTIVNNDADKVPEYGIGGNVYAYFDYYGSGLVANNIISGAKSGGGLIYYRGADDVIRFNNVWGNTPADYGIRNESTGAVAYDEGADWTGRFGNISEDPKFRNAAMNDFHLQPVSPCVSAGDPNGVPGQASEDVDGDPRIFAVRVDIGADEHVGYVKPLADAGADQHKLVPEPITLDGTTSYVSDPEGPKTYLWQQTQGTPVELSDAGAGQPVFTPPAEGWYVFELVVSDDQYESNPDRVLVVIGNEAPVADAGPDRLWPAPGFIELDGSRSSDADPPDELTYTWTQIDGPPIDLYHITPEEALLYSVSPSFAYFECKEPGIYVFELVASDGFSTSAPDTVRIEAAPFTLNAVPLEIPEPEQYYTQYPAVSGAKLVYGTGEYSDSSWSIQCLDFESGRIDTFQAQPTDTMPVIDGDIIVWATGADGYYRPICTSIAMGDLATGVDKTLRQNTSTDSYGYPALSGRKVVWLHHRGVNTTTITTTQYEQSRYSVEGADITNPAEPVYFTIAADVGQGLPYPFENGREAYERPVDISGNLVVWEAQGDIYGADISDLDHIRIFPICTAPKVQKDPSISGSVVVWTDQRDDIGDIYGADISDPNNIREFEVYVAPGPQQQADIDGTMIAFVEGSIYGYVRLCCLTGRYGVYEAALPGWHYGANPQLDGSTLIWHYYERMEGLTLDFGYSLAEGPVQNLTTGAYYERIQHAIDAASPGDTILVEPGEYREKIRFKGKDLTLTSIDPEDPAWRAATVITGDGQLVTIADDETADCILTGFTIAGGSYGLFCAGATPTIDNCVVADNSYAGVKVWNRGNPTLSRCELTGNGIGAEMWAHRESRTILRNYGLFRNCLVTGSREVGFYSGYPTLENCTVADNRGAGVDAVTAQIVNSILYFNDQDAAGFSLKIEDMKKSSVTYSDVQGGWEGEGNIDADPLFVSRGQWVPTGDVAVGTGNRVSIVPGAPDWTVGDYHLQSEGWSWNVLEGAWAWDEATSPCIDAGDPTALLGTEPPCGEGDPLRERAGANTRVNLGAYGGTTEASLAPMP